MTTETKDAIMKVIMILAAAFALGAVLHGCDEDLFHVLRWTQ